MGKGSQMTKVDLYNDSRVLVPICEQCLKGSHLDPCEHDHREGLNDEDGIGDCKNTGMLDGTLVQCCCGTGGFVYSPKLANRKVLRKKWKITSEGRRRILAWAMRNLGDAREAKTRR